MLLRSDGLCSGCGVLTSERVNILQSSADATTAKTAGSESPTQGEETASPATTEESSVAHLRAMEHDLIHAAELSETKPREAAARVATLMAQAEFHSAYGYLENTIQANSFLRNRYFEHIFAPYLDASQAIPASAVFKNIPAKLDDVDTWLAECDLESPWRRRIFPIYVDHLMELEERERKTLRRQARLRNLHRRLAWCFLLSFIGGACFAFAGEAPGWRRPAVWMIFLLGSVFFLYVKWPAPSVGDSSWWAAGRRAIRLVIGGMVAGWLLMWVSLWVGQGMDGKQGTVSDRPSAPTAADRRPPQDLVSPADLTAPLTPPAVEQVPHASEETPKVVEAGVAVAEQDTAEDILAHEDEALIFRVSGLAENAVLRVRRRAGDQQSVEAWFSEGESGLRIIGKPVVVGTTEWVQILFGERKGWVERRYLRSELEGELLPVAEVEPGDAPADPAVGKESATTASTRSLAERLKDETPKPVPTPSPPMTTAPVAPPPAPAAGGSLVKAKESGPPAGEKIGVPRYRVGGLGQNGILFMRQGPGDGHPLVAQLGDGQGGLIGSGTPVTVGTIEWVPIRFKNQSGWVKRPYLQLEKQTADPAQSLLEEGDEGEEAQSKSESAAAGSPDLMDGTTAGAAVGLRPWQGRLLRVTGIGERDTLNVRRGPGVRFSVVAQLVNGEGGITVVGDPVVNGSTAWVYISFGSESGWVSSQYLQAE
jgi:uncharacterized protein YraI